MPRKKAPRAVGPSDVDTGVRIRALRPDAGFSQEELGERLGVSFQQVQKYERGKNRVSLARAVEIARVLKTSLDALAGLDGGKPQHLAVFDVSRYRLAQSFDGLDEHV